MDTNKAKFGNRELVKGYNGMNKVGITKYGDKDYYINNSKANLEIE